MRIGLADADTGLLQRGWNCFCCAPWARRAFTGAAAPFEAATRTRASRPASKNGAKVAKRRSPRSAGAAAFRSIDVHHHIAPRFYVDAIGPEKMVNTYAGSAKAAYEWSPAMALEDMDKGGTATAITSLYSANHMAEHPQSVKLARQCNDYAAQMVRDHPGRFGMFAALPMLDIDGALKEVEYAMDVLKADGVYMLTSYRGKWLGDPMFAPVFDELHRRKVLLYTHPVVPRFAQNLIEDVPDTVIEINTDTTRSIASVLFSGTASRCSDVDIIWSHGGGTILPVIERMERLAERPKLAARLPRGITHELRRFYYDVAQVAHPVPMAALMKMVPLSQILFGTDFTFRTADEINEGLAKCKLTARQLHAIRRGNALKLLPQRDGP